MLQALRDDVSDVDIAPLGDPGHPESEDTVLAGRFPEKATAAVAQLISEAGGVVVADVDEAWTRPREMSPPTSWNPRFGRERLHA